MPEPIEQTADAAPGLNFLVACYNSPLQAVSDKVCHSDAFCADIIQDDVPGQRAATLEYFLEDFSLADPKQNTLSTKGNMFFMSTCGAKILYRDDLF